MGPDDQLPPRYPQHSPGKLTAEKKLAVLLKGIAKAHDVKVDIVQNLGYGVLDRDKLKLESENKPSGNDIDSITFATLPPRRKPLDLDQNNRHRKVQLWDDGGVPVAWFRNL